MDVSTFTVLQGMSFHRCPHKEKFLSLKKKIVFNVYLFLSERERHRVQVGEGGAERETQNLRQAAGSEPSAQSLTRGSNPQTMKS